MYLSKMVKVNKFSFMSWETAIQRFIVWRKAEGISKRTLNGYESNLKTFFKRYPLAWPDKCREFVLQHLSQEEISPSTYNNRLKTFRPFFNFTITEGILTTSPIANIKYRRGEAPRIVDHTMEDVLKLFKVIGSETFAQLRDSTLFLFSFDTGIRPSEALELLPNDLDVELLKATIPPMYAKTRIGRRIFYSDKTALLINKLLSVRPLEWKNSTQLFCNSYGNKMNTHTWGVQLRRYTKKAGLNRFSPYDLRHQFAIEYLRNGGDVFTLQKLLGHSTLSMTERYLALSNDDIQRVHAKVSPVSALFPPIRKGIGKI